MKPLRLTLSGLNSFKEEQEVDFRYLCDGNVFGIFGPTGSGKSTLLDAITLALYGKVERAPGRIQGIVNKGTDSASVLFEFELAGSGDSKLYRVERKYVSKDDTISCRYARLTELSSKGDVVLADKVSQVDDKVEQILGLTVEDFTRAVVLPQGKFAEFLSLKGTERREMLERIFNLSDYGERLVSIATMQYKEVESAVKNLQSEQAGLGDASNAAVQEALTALELCMNEIAVSKEVMNEHQSERDQTKILFEMQQALSRAESGLAIVDSEEHVIVQLQDKLQRLAEATRVEPQLRLYDESEETQRLASAAMQVVNDRIVLLRASKQKHIESVHQATQARQQEEPVLTLRLSDLKRAQQLEEKQREFRITEQRELDSFMRLEQALDSLRMQRADLTTREESLGKHLATLESELTACTVKAEVRGDIERATACEAEWKQARKLLGEVTQELELRRVASARAQSTLLEAQNTAAVATREYVQAEQSCRELESIAPQEVSAEMLEVAGKHRALMEKVKALAAGRENVAMRRESTRQRLITTGNELQALEKSLAEMRLRADALAPLINEDEARLLRARELSMAEVLSARLTPGEACPVCGSREHPAKLACGSVDDHIELEAALEEKRKVLQTTFISTAAIQARIEATLHEQEDVTSIINDLDGELRRLGKELEAALRGLPTEWVKLPLGELEEKIIEQSLRYEQSIEHRRVWSLQLEVERGTERTRLAKQALANQALALSQQHATVSSREVEILVLKHQEAERNELVHRRTLDEYLKQLGIAELKTVREEVASKDRKQAELNNTYKQLLQRRNELQTTKKDIEQQLAQDQEVLAVLRAKLAGLQEQIVELTREIELITVGRSALEEFEAAESRLRQIKETEVKHQAELVEAQRLLSEAESEGATRKEALRLADLAQQKAAVQLEKIMDDSGFSSREMVAEALGAQSYKNQWEADVKRHFEAKAVALNEAARLREQLSGRVVSQERWDHVQEQYDQSKEKYDLALTERGQSEARLTDIQKRNERYEELESKRLGLVTKRDMLYEVVGLMRGNALVEYMAAEHLHSIAVAATEWLRLLTAHRYALEVDPDGGFVIRDDGNGGIKRPVHTLSGGETFVTSLALALSLSAQIQLRGRYPLEFFFLDEGFGTLDPELLDTVMGCLERMQGQHMSIGIISHVPELRERIERKVVVIPAERGGRGSRLKVV